MKKSMIPDINLKESDRKFRAIISELSQENTRKAVTLRNLSAYLSKIAKDNSLLVAEPGPCRAKTASRMRRSVSSEYRHPFKEFSPEEIELQIRQTQLEYEQTLKEIDNEKLHRMYLNRLKLVEEKSTAKCVAQKLKWQYRTEEKERSTKQVKELLKIATKEILFSEGCRKRSKADLKSFRKDCL
jgi:hypothetical protein